MSAFTEGLDAFHNGQPLGDNPYDAFDETENFDEWLSGWQAGEECEEEI